MGARVSEIDAAIDKYPIGAIFSTADLHVILKDGGTNSASRCSKLAALSILERVKKGSYKKKKALFTVAEINSLSGKRNSVPQSVSVIAHLNAAGAEGVTAKSAAEALNFPTSSVQTILCNLSRAKYLTKTDLPLTGLGPSASKKRYAIIDKIPTDLAVSNRMAPKEAGAPVVVLPPQPVLPVVKEKAYCRVEMAFLVEEKNGSNGIPSFNLDFAEDVLGGCPEAVKGARVIGVKPAKPDEDYVYRLHMLGGVTRE